MQFLAHRGLWEHPLEKNSRISFVRAAEEGFGLETDVRDCCGKLVISHDMPSGEEISLIELLSLYSERRLNLDAPIALNIKADGMASAVKEILMQFENLNSFVFDMSVPDMRGYFSNKIPVFTRMSEVETEAVWIQKSNGVWLDAFEVDWFSTQLIADLLVQNKKVCVVSPELHSRNKLDVWHMLKDFAQSDLISLCTDLPREARDFFN